VPAQEGLECATIATIDRLREVAQSIRWVRSYSGTVKYGQGQQILVNKLSVTKADQALRQHGRTARVGIVPDRLWSTSTVRCHYTENNSQIKI
jgi:hypothetical protein